MLFQKPKLKNFWLYILVFTVNLFAQTAQSQDSNASFHSFTEQFNKSFALYREAASYIRTENLDIAAIQLEELIADFKTLRENFKGMPPAPYDSNSNFDSDLENLSKNLDESLLAIDRGDQDAAWALVSKIRKEVYAFQTQSGIYNLATCVYDLNSAMDLLWPYFNNGFDIENEGTRNTILTLNAGVAVWVRHCKAIAPMNVRQSEEFARLFDNYLASKITIRESMEARDTGRFVRIMGEIRSLDRLIYLRFG